MPPITLYYFATSGPSRATILAARVLGVPVEKIQVNLFEKKQLDDKFVRINPQHCLPTIDDDGFILWESRAIAAYFANKYGKNDAIYPRDPQQRALVDQRLYFDVGTLYPRVRDICYPVLYLGETKISQLKKDNLKKSIDFLELFLIKDWVTGDQYTLADIFLSVTISSILAIGLDMCEYPRILAWMKRCEETLPGFAENLEAAKAFGNNVMSKLTESIND